MTPISIIFIILAIIIIALISLYNRLVRLRVHTQEAWSDIDVQLKRRYDLIPNLIETVKGYAAHERETLQEVLEARAKAGSLSIDLNDASQADLQALAGAEDGLSGALNKLFAVAENYPDLKANENFLELQRELTDTEDKIQASRRFYNSTVRSYTTAIQTFPTNIIAGQLGFKEQSFFELSDPAEREPVAVNFNTEDK
jgi:LemA protein